MFCSAVSTVQILLSEFRSLPSFPLALVTIILCMSIWVTAWPHPAFSTHWQKWRVNSGRHCKGGWLWVRTINGFNLAPANSYCTYSWCKEHQISYETQNYLPYSLILKHRECVGYCWSLSTWWLFIEQFLEKWSKNTHTFSSQIGNGRTYLWIQPTCTHRKSLMCLVAKQVQALSAAAAQPFESSV